MTFESFFWDPRLAAGIQDCGYSSPTPIQERAIPAVLAGRDVIGLAQTGTGKTAAFALPLLQRLLDGDAGPNGPVRVLVLSPTRELAVQIHESFDGLGRHTGIRSCVIIGGVGMGPQIQAFSRSTVAVACPGRLIDLANQGRVGLRHVQALVLDEADRMLDMGFLPDIRRILALLPGKRQNLLFSATMPREILGLAEGILRSPAVVQVANTAPAAGVRHCLYPVAPSRKPELLQALLEHAREAGGMESVLVFTRTKHRAKGLARKLISRGWTAAALQGNMSQNARQRALDGFRRGQTQILVATDIAARGIDCERITHVVNFDIPDTVEAYTHRIGRTGRMDRPGEAYTFITPEDADQVRMIERGLGRRIPRERLEGMDVETSSGEREPTLGCSHEQPAGFWRNKDRRGTGQGRAISGRVGQGDNRRTDGRFGPFADRCAEGSGSLRPNGRDGHTHHARQGGGQGCKGSA